MTATRLPAAGEGERLEREVGEGGVRGPEEGPAQRGPGAGAVWGGLVRGLRDWGGDLTAGGPQCHHHLSLNTMS